MKIVRILVLVALSVLVNSISKAQSKAFLKQIGVKDSLFSRVLNENREIYVQLPEYYNPMGHEKYPVVYLLDGKVFLPTVVNVHQFYSGGFMPEMVIVGISNAKNRMRDLTTSKVKEMYGQPFTQEHGEAEKFTAFLKDELIPYIEKKYPVTNYRTLIGHSYGGLFAMYTLVHHPNMFANYLAIDPSMDWDNSKLISEAKTALENNNYRGKSLFMTLGGQLHMQDYSITIDNVMEDKSDFTKFARANISCSNLIKEHSDNGLKYDWKFYPNDLHGTISFPSIYDGLLNMFEWYQMENTDKINDSETPKAALVKLINYRETKLKKHFGYAEPPYPEDLLNMSGYMSMDMDKTEKAKMYFEMAIKYYPNSANAYDSMAEFYERTGNNPQAIHFYTKAFELSGDSSFQDKIKRLEK